MTRGSRLGAEGLTQMSHVQAPNHSTTTPGAAMNLAAKLATFDNHFHPHVVGQFNGHDVMLTKLKGEFVWHSHPETDDSFLVLKGRLIIQLRGGDVSLGAGELFVVPRGVEHCPGAEEETHLLVMELTGTPNTGDASTAAPRRVI
jgi:mannose-6-phosphate isomerase-like protein (cupin superfamily)